MISIDDVTVSYGSFVLLDKINFHISEQDKIGLVGRNGAGKSTVMKLICGLQKATSGQIDKPNDVTIGYLPQIMEHHKGRTVIEETMTAFDDFHSIEREIEKVSAELASRDDYESTGYAALITRLNDLNDHLQVSLGEPPEVQARKTLFGLGFKENELSRKTETFSQGWNMRIELAKILLKKPDVLLLDEPTNHLDIESIEWLEDYLKSCRASILLVSHDRKFLDNVTNRTVEIFLGRIHDYKVPYSHYLELRAERISQQTAAYENQRRMIEKTEDFINKFRYKPTKSNQVQSRVKALAKLERIEIDETDNVTMKVKFPSAPRSGDVVFKAIDASLGYPQKLVLKDFNMEIKRGEKVAFVGRNGEGKTTLMRLLMRELSLESGEAKIGHNVSLGYYAQNQEDTLDKADTVFSTLDRAAIGEVRTKLRDILAAFLFRDEDIDKRVSVLSGGERARLGLAKLMLQSYNVLALDEPTNHLDIKAKDILKQALMAFDGTLILVSHDRDFLEGLVDKVYEFRDGRVWEYLGTVSDFLYRRKMENLRELDRRFEPQQTAVQSSVQPSTQPLAAKLSYQEMKQKSREEKKKKDRISYLEHEITKLEKEMADIEAVLSNPAESDDIMELTRSYLNLKRDLDAKTEEWGSLI